MNVSTIITKSHVPFARVLATTLREHNPGGSLSVLVLDDSDGYVDPAAEPFTLLTPDDIGCDAFDRMAADYTVLELATAVKPWLLETLLERDDHAVYLDADVEVVGDLTPLRDLAAEHGIVLTPHTLTPIPRDGRLPREQTLLMCGAYNLGFIAVGRAAIPMLRWWQERLRTDCVIDVAQGLFYDQKWIDLVPGLWPRTAVLDDPGYNAAYWNYHERRLDIAADGSVRVNGRPGRFLHFSGFDPHRPDRLSRYEDRFDLARRTDLAAATARYARSLLDAGYDEAREWPYAIARLGIGPGGDDALPGVNVVGYLDSAHGVGQSARGLIAALDAAGAPVVPVSIPGDGGLPAFEHPGSGGPAQPVTLLVANADVLPEVVDVIAPELVAGRRTVAFWAWETERLPSRWRPSADLVDEIWAGSRFVADAITTVVATPVAVVPTPVVLHTGPRPDRARFGLPDGFLFLFVFDFNSIVRRKNPLGLVEAFRRAFPQPGGGPVLVLKSVNGDRHPHALGALRQAAAGRPDIRILDVRLDQADRESLLASCDCYVSLHRSEGFGLTIGEAMLLGRPVIATGYGGSNELVSERTAYPVRYELAAVGPGAPPYAPDDRWAEPDLDHAAELMRQVVADPAGAARVAAAGREHVERRHSPSAVGAVIAERLRRLGARPAAAHGPPAPAAADALPDAARARHETLMLLERPRRPARGPRGLAQRMLRRIVRSEAALRDEGDRALWWSIESSSVVAAARHADLVHAVETHERLLAGLRAETTRLRAENDELRLIVAAHELERRRAGVSDAGGDLGPAAG